ncbi:hypothetical protein H5410_023125 [Solanum commersonii]|uniref:phospholipase D n=1 Tax=Solanum commersonii TaxID=4109 RepID=A0A9J5ZJ60_SOLCO|nr:hypothetical protein H5410_023125 [Solanum commersonii]
MEKAYSELLQQTEKREKRRDKGVKLHLTPMQTFQTISEIISSHKDFSNLRDVGKTFLMQSTMQSINPKRPKVGGELTLEEVLKNKANEVVKRDGPRSTHDQESGKALIQGFQVGTLFTHHQKTIVVDIEIPRGMSHKRMIVSLGGIDLCDGQYDTQDHSLFRTLDTIHKQDFYQPSFPGSSIAKGGPREPWHDINCRLEGPAVWDVLYIFEQRWRKHIGNKFIYSMNELDKFIIRPTKVTTSRDRET